MGPQNFGLGCFWKPEVVQEGGENGGPWLVWCPVDVEGSLGLITLLTLSL